MNRIQQQSRRKRSKSLTYWQRCFSPRRLSYESLELRLAMDATGLAGNPYSPNLDVTAVPTQAVRAGDQLVLDLRAAGATVTDLDANGNPSGDIIRFQLDPDDTPAGATITADGVITWTPSAEQTGRFELIVFAIDSGTPPLADAEVVVVNVAENIAPDLASISDQTVAVNAVLQVTIAATDSDGDNLTFMFDRDDPNSTLPADATLEQLDNNHAVIRWTPDAADAGASFDFSVIVTDDAFPPHSDLEKFTVNVMTVAAEDDTYVVTVDGALTVEPALGVLANDSDSNGDSITATIVSTPGNGSVTLATDGSFTYTPNTSFRGTDTFTYQARDAGGDHSQATVTIHVNSGPVVLDDAYTTAEDTTLSVDVASGVLNNDSDPDGDPLTVSLIDGAANGTATLNGNGSFIYVPNAEFHGTDTFTYEAGDGIGTSTATVTITVTAVNDAPHTMADSYTASEDSPLTVATENGVLSNDSDVEGDAPTATLNMAAANGSVTLNSDGSFAYMPNADFSGNDSFTYIASDGSANSVETTVTITVNSVNDPPQSMADTYSATEDTSVTIDAVTGVLSNDSDFDGDTLTATLISDVNNGSVSLNSDGSFTYTPDADFHGMDSFTYVANDGATDSAVTTVSISVSSANDAPQATADTYSATEDTSVTIDAATGVLSNDSDFEGDTLTATLISDVNNGSVSLNSDGSFTYTPDADFHGMDSFTYVANDGAADSAVTTVSISVSSANDAPQAIADTYSTGEGTLLNVDAGTGVLANDTDMDGDSLTVALVVNAINGTLTLNSDGSFTYTPDPNFSGTDSFTYTASDGTETTPATTVTITVVEQDTSADEASGTPEGEGSTGLLDDVFADEKDWLNPVE